MWKIQKQYEHFFVIKIIIQWNSLVIILLWFIMTKLFHQQKTINGYFHKLFLTRNNLYWLASKLFIYLTKKNNKIFLLDITHLLSFLNLFLNLFTIEWSWVNDYISYHIFIQHTNKRDVSLNVKSMTHCIFKCKKINVSFKQRRMRFIILCYICREYLKFTLSILFKYYHVSY